LLGWCSLMAAIGCARPPLVADGWPYQRMSWPDLEQAKHRAESIALSAIPLDPKLDAKIRRENMQGHPLALQAEGPRVRSPMSRMVSQSKDRPD
jgi:hypothetical protein